MRKVLLSLLVLALAAPSFAAVNITAEDAGSGVLKLYYECTAGEVIRGLALAVEVTDGDGVVAAASDAVVPAASRFNTFIDYAFTVEAGAPGTYTIGAGHPLANKVAAGVATFPATVYSVSMGCLDEFEKVQGGVTGSGELVAITYTLTADTTVAISADTLRGGIVGDGITEVNIQASQTLVGVSVPECWKKSCFTYGDANGDGLITAADITILINSWTNYNPCADFNKDGLVTAADITILINNWATGCPQ